MTTLLYKIPESLNKLLNQEFLDPLLKNISRMETGIEQVKLLSMVQERSDSERKLKIQNLLLGKITYLAKKIAGGSSARTRKVVVPYRPGLDDIVVDRTLEESPGSETLTGKDIFCYERVRQKGSYTLMLDVSNSMHREKIAVASLAVGVFSCKLQEDFQSVLTFAREAQVIKDPDEPNDLEELVRRMLEIKSGGATNILKAMRTGHSLLEQSKTKHKVGILVSDGWATVGGDPLPAAAGFKQLHVLGISLGLGGSDPDTNARIARKGKGRYLYVRDFNDLPLAVKKILG